ncbi:hypothetical protein, partial [Actinomyces oris]|uniref:hypothetical protein n=1 Tax=Actinomyces oris TaxID=544580 RepID=UPI002852C830
RVPPEPRAPQKTDETPSDQKHRANETTHKTQLLLNTKQELPHQSNEALVRKFIPSDRGIGEVIFSGGY